MKKIKILAVLLLLALLSACSGLEEEEHSINFYGYDGEDEQDILIQNEYLELHFVPETAEISVVDKRSGNRLDSTPQGALDDPLADPMTRRLMQSQFSLTYATTSGNTATLSSYEHSVAKGMYMYEVLPNGIEVRYTVGNIDRVYVMPIAVPESRMKEFYDLMERSDQRKLDEYYRKYDINRLRATDDRAALVAAYPDLETEPVYVLRDTIQTYLKAQIEDMFAAVGYTTEDFEIDSERYETSSDLDAPVFNIVIRYELDDDSLIVTVPFDEADYSRNDMPMTQLNLLPYLTSGGVEDEGYMLVPDGGGALIRLNNGKYNQIAYNNNMYGWDLTLKRDAIINDNRALFPVFGVNVNDKAVICIIEEGSSYSTIRANVSGGNSSYNNVFSQYSMIRGETMDISSKSDTPVILYERGLPEGEQIVQRYVFCEDSGYVGMAKAYREYLMEEYPQLTKLTTTEVPVAVEIIGAVNSTQHILGMPFDLPLKLTSYSEAEAMVNEINNNLGWNNVQYKLTGWFNDSVQHSVPSSVNPIGRLGSRNDLRNLISTAGNMYMEADFMYMRDTTTFDGFSLNSDAARYINRERIESYPFSFVWFGERTSWGKLSYIARPGYMMGLIDNFLSEIQKLGTSNIAFRSLGSQLAGDYNERNYVSREASMNMQVDKLRELKQNGSNVMVNMGYAYVLPYVDFIVEMPLTGQAFSILDEEVPFYQIALHGIVQFAGRPVNLAEDYKSNLLKSVETGAGLYFNFMTENASILQETRFFEYYANEYSKWIDTANEIYQEFDKNLSFAYNQFIVDHDMLRPLVTLTVYEDGSEVIVNRSNYDYDYNGITVPPRDYIVLRGGE